MRVRVAALMSRQRQVLMTRRQLLRTLFHSGGSSAHALVVLNVIDAAVPAMAAVAAGALIGFATGRDGRGAEATYAWLALAAFAVLRLFSYVLGPVRVALEASARQRIDDALRAQVLHLLAAPAGTEHLESDALVAQTKVLLGGGVGYYTLGFCAVGQLSLLARFATTLGATLVVATVSVPLATFLILGTLAARFRNVGRENGFTAAQAYSIDRTRRAHYFAGVCQDVNLAKELRVFGLGPWLAQRYGDTWEDGASRLRSNLYRSIPFHAPTNLLSGVVQSVGFATLGHGAASGQFGLGAMSRALTAARSMTAAESAGEDQQQDLYGRALLDNLAALRDLSPPAQPGGLDAEGLPAVQIEFQQVDYRYPGGGDVLRGLDLTLPAGTSTAIVGANGAGKTTLIKLLAGLATPDSGVIRVDGRPLTDVDLTSWRRQLAVIYQDFVRYEMSVADNLCLGAPRDEVSPAALRRAVARANATDVLDELGWDLSRVLTRQIEGGVDLSGGQWQKLALARAFCAVERGARVLVLDEPTASLDVRSEADIFDRFLSLTRGLTTVLVSHRFSTVRRADRIVVLDQGRIIETGSHEDLIAANGAYAGMFHTQARRIRGDGS